jgi:asparagine N-glycosylation enzyme membrane subunit Stt3
MFPIVGSVCVLFAYFTVKNVGNDKIHQLGTLFTTLLSTSVFSSTLLSFARHSLPRSFFGRHEQIKFTISKSGHSKFYLQTK